MLLEIEEAGRHSCVVQQVNNDLKRRCQKLSHFIFDRTYIDKNIFGRCTIMKIKRQKLVHIFYSSKVEDDVTFY